MNYRKLTANFRKLFFWLSVVCVACLLLSCHTTKQAENILVGERSRTTNHDTIYLHDLRYDSIYVSQDKYTDRTRDTITITNTKTEFRYRLQRDTILKCHTDTVIQIDSIMVSTPPHKGGGRERVFTWYDKLAYTIAAIALIYLLFRIRSPFFSLIRKFI